jgi:hypothetical protein
VAVPVANVKIALTPRGIRRRSFRIDPGRKGSLIHRIYIVDPEHDSAPDGPSGRAGGVELKIEEARANPEARKTGLSASVARFKAERFVERHGLRHVRGEQGYRADALDGTSLRLHTHQSCRQRKESCREVAPSLVAVDNR